MNDFRSFDMKAYLYYQRRREQERKEKRENVILGTLTVLLGLSLCVAFSGGIMGVI